MPHTAAASASSLRPQADAGHDEDEDEHDDGDELLFDDDLLVEGDDVDGEELHLDGEGEILELDEVIADAVVTEGAQRFDKDALTRRDVWHGLVHCIVSNGKLWSTVDVGEVKQVMEGPIGILPHGPLLLEPLWRYMLAKGTPKKAAAETLLFFQSRAPRWGIQIELPAAMNELQEETRAAVADKLSARGVTTGTFVGHAPTPPAARKRKTAQRKKLVGKRSKSLEGEPGAVRAALAKIALVVALVVVGGLIALRDGAPEDVSARASAALGPVCDHAAQAGRAVLCTTDAVTLATSSGLRERRAVTEVALDVAIVFVDKEGLPLPMPPAR